ncbi:MAG: hypothetical protein PHG66_06795 [Candidatus Colwellbacteria bacterium]|nr:hypothetical protein [Candidatus Colwellbacteria bacterium]
MKIGDLIKELKKGKPFQQVYFDFGGCFPTDVDSWRGVYAEPALGWTNRAIDFHTKFTPPMVSQLITRLEEAVNGKEFEGYKGGKFKYTKGAEIHIDNYGECTHTEIESVEHYEYVTIIKTKYEED